MKEMYTHLTMYTHLKNYREKNAIIFSQFTTVYKSI